MFLITGYGSIGSLVVDQIVNEHSNAKIIIIDKDEKAIHKALIRFKDNPLVTSVVADISIAENIEKVFLKNKIEKIVHTAAMKHVTFCEQNPLLASINNIIGINNLLKIAAINGVKKFINVSTDKSAYPSNVMGATKFIAERTVLSYNNINGMNCQSVRLGNVISSTGSLIPTIINIVENDLTLDLTNLSATRFFITPDEVCQFIVNAVHDKYDGDIIIKKLKSATLGTMVNATLTLINKSGYKNIKIVGLRQGEKLHEHLFSGAEVTNIKDDGGYWSIDYNKTTSPEPLIDSSQFCVSEDEFLQMLKKLKC